MKHLIGAIILVLCTGTISAKTYLVDCNLAPTVSDELLAQHNNDGGTYALYKGKYYRIGVTGFRSLKEFADNQTTCGATSGDTLYVAPGVYTEGATVNVAGLTILGHNANRDWTAARDALETELQAVLYIEASNITVNGFKVTKAGRIISATATNSAPIKNLRVIYNKFENSTVKRDWGYQVVYFGPRATGSGANDPSSQLRYLDCEVAHNHFYYPAGTTTTFPNGVDISGAGGTTHVHDNYFNSGGTSVSIENGQGVINVKNNVFKNVGKDTWDGADGGAKGDFAVYFERCAFANSTTAYIQDNEFDGCTGQATLAPIIRVWGGNASSTTFVTPVNFNININRNTFKGKTTIITSEIMTATNGATDQAGENLILYQDNQDVYDDTRYNIQDNHYDNRFYKYAWIRLNDGMPRQEIYANNFSEFKLGSTDSSFGNANWTTGDIGSTEQTTDITNHAAWINGTSILHYKPTFIQSFDIDMETGDLYFIQDLSATEGDAMAKKYGASHDTEECLILTRVKCTYPALPHTSSAARRGYQYGTSYESMKLFRAGHGVKLSIVRDKDGQLWMLTGAKGTTRASSGSNTLSGNAVAKFKFVNGAQVILDGRTTAHSADLKWDELELSYIDHPIDGLTNVYGTVDELSRYFCFSSSVSGQREYCIYDLDDILEEKANPRLIKRINIKCGTVANTQRCLGTDGLAEFKAADKGFETWSYQSYAIAGDYLYFLEGTGPNSGITKGDPTIVVSVYNWRTGQYLNRTRINYGRTNASYGEPEGIVLRPDIYGNSTLYLALVDGENAGVNEASIYKYHINRYIQHFDDDDGYSTLTYRVSGDDLPETSTHFDASQYPAIEFSHAVTSDDANVTCSETDIDFGTLSDASPRTAVVTITNAGEYRYGQWAGTITGTDGGQFKVDVSDNEQFQTSTVTATVTFTPDIKKREYNASLRLHSPLATSNEESNDIVINLTAAYDGPLTYGMAPRMATGQVTQTIDNETYYSFNLAYNAMLPEPYDNAYLAYTNGEAADVLPFRELIDKYVVVMEDATGNFESTDLIADKATHITVGNENAHEGDDWATALSSKNVDNTYSKKGYGSVERDNFADQISITNGFEVSQANASESKTEGSAHYISYADVYSKPLVFHNVDPNKAYNFRLYLSKSSADKMDAWKALYLDYADGASNAMYIPSTTVAYNNTTVKAVDEDYTADTDASDMPIGSHNTITDEGVVLTDPVHYRGVNEISAEGNFGTLHVTSEVVDFWDIDYDISLGGDITASYADNKMNEYKNSDGLLKGITTSLSYLPVEFATVKKTAEDGRTRNEPVEASQTYNTSMSVGYARTTDNSLPGIFAKGVSNENGYEFSNAPIFTGLDLNSDNVMAKLWERTETHLIYGSWNYGAEDYHKYYYDAFMQLNWSDDIELNHGVGVYASSTDLQCVGHNNVVTAPTQVLSDTYIDNIPSAPAKSLLCKIGYNDFTAGYDESNNWSEIAAKERTMPIYVHYVYGDDNKITASDAAEVLVTLTADYPVLVKETPVLTIGGGVTEKASLLSAGNPTEWIDMVTIPTKTLVSISGSDIITGIERVVMGNESLSIYPNPATEFVNISSSADLQYVEIYSIDGQLMKCEYADTAYAKINVSDLAPGTYILRAANQSTILIKR